MCFLVRTPPINQAHLPRDSKNIIAYLFMFNYCDANTLRALLVLMVQSHHDPSSHLIHPLSPGPHLIIHHQVIIFISGPPIPLISNHLVDLVDLEGGVD